MNKQQRHNAIRQRARRAIQNLYHNATPTYPRLDEDSPGYECFEEWLSDIARNEIEYMQDGGAYGRDYPATLRSDANAGRFKSVTARAYYIRKEMRDMRRERARCCQWERIGELGKLYTYGRGGRTLAPQRLIRGGSYNWRPDEDYADDMPISDCVDLILIMESFNRAVESWCASVPEQWADFVENNIVATRCEAAELGNN